MIKKIPTKKTSSGSVKKKKLAPAKKKATTKKAEPQKKRSSTLKKAAAKKTIKKRSVTRKKAAAKKTIKKRSVTRKKATAKRTIKKKSVTRKKATAKKTIKKKSVTRKKATAKKTIKKKSATRKKATAKKTTAKRPVKRRATPPTKTVRKKNQARMIKPGEEKPVQRPHQAGKGGAYMDKQQLTKFRKSLLNWKKELMQEVDKTVNHMKADATNFADPADRATQEEEFSLELRTRDRERKLIKKIDAALKMMQESEYGYCTVCGAEIGIMRLRARPTATLCIECKGLQELRERQLAD